MNFGDAQSAAISFLEEVPGYNPAFLLAIVIVWLIASAFYNERTFGYLCR